jgi:hypothetical protein
MAGLGRKEWSPGDTLNAADVNGYLMDQTVMVFAGTAARASAIPTPSAGMVAYSTATNLEYYDGAAWEPVGVSPGLVLISTTPITTTASTTIQGCFSATYTNYLVMWSGVCSTSNGIIIQLANGSTPVTTNYSRQRIQANSTTVAGNLGTGLSGFLVGQANTTEPNFSTVTIVNPFLAVPTGYFSNNAHNTNTTTMDIETGKHTGSTSFDGLVFLTSAGATFTGTVSIYGVSK